VCTNCNKKGYCSAQCQERDWPQHSSFCRAVSSRRERRKSRRSSRGLSSAGRGSTEKCVCGKDAEYECSSCQRQGYCSQKCQVDDWELHEYFCNRPGSNHDTRKMTSASTRRSLASRYVTCQRGVSVGRSLVLIARIKMFAHPYGLALR